MYEYPAEIRRLIYTTNTVEGYNRQLRKVVKTKGALPKRRRSPKTAVSGEPRHHEGLDRLDLQLGEDSQSVGDSVRGTISIVGEEKSFTQTT